MWSRENAEHHGGGGFWLSARDWTSDSKIIMILDEKAIIAYNTALEGLTDNSAAELRKKNSAGSLIK